MISLVVWTVGLASIFGGFYFGRKVMRDYWRLDLPYDQRPTMAFGMRGGNVPYIPPKRRF